MPKLYFSHTITREKSYQQKLPSQKQWFEEHDFPVFLPEKIDNASLNKNAAKVNKKLPDLQKRWAEIENEYFAVIQSFKHAKLLPRYICHVSLYGPEGEFQAPNLLLVRLRTDKDKRQVLETIGHELIHIFLGNFFDRHKLSYGEVEWLVDNLILQSSLSKLFPNYKQQSVGKPRKKILDEILS